VRPERAPSWILAALTLLVTEGAAGQGARDPAPEAVIATLAFERTGEPNRVYLDLAPEGHDPFVMLLDTGASQSVITPVMARQLGVSVRRTKNTPYRRPTRLGRDLQFWIDTRSSDTGSKTGWEYGLLGGEFLDDYVLEIDFPGGLVRFLDPKHYEVPESVAAPDEAVVDFERGGTRIHVPIELNGEEVRVLLDTGAPWPLVLSGKAARRSHVDIDSLAPFGEAGTTLGPMEVRLYEAPRLGFAGFDLEPVPILVAPKGWYNLAGPNDSVLGYDLLAQFVMRIDYERRRIWLKRTLSGPIPFYGTDYASSRELGAFVIPTTGGRFLVWDVASDGPADAMGLRDGDVILEALGEAKLTVEEVRRRIRAREELTVARQQGDVWVDLILPEAGEPAP
jgi:predicted aspartyl protease